MADADVVPAETELLAIQKNFQLDDIVLDGKRAKDCDNRPEEETYSALLVGEITKRRVDFDTADSRSLCEILRDKWLQDKEFDCVRDEDKFRKIVESLS